MPKDIYCYNGIHNWVPWTDGKLGLVFMCTQCGVKVRTLEKPDEKKKRNKKLEK